MGLPPSSPVAFDSIRCWLWSAPPHPIWARLLSLLLVACLWLDAYHRGYEAGGRMTERGGEAPGVGVKARSQAGDGVRVSEATSRGGSAAVEQQSWQSPPSAANQCEQQPLQSPAAAAVLLPAASVASGACLDCDRATELTRQDQAAHSELGMGAKPAHRHCHRCGSMARIDGACSACRAEFAGRMAGLEESNVASLLTEAEAVLSHPQIRPLAAVLSSQQQQQGTPVERLVEVLLLFTHTSIHPLMAGVRQQLAEQRAAAAVAAQQTAAQQAVVQQTAAQRTAAVEQQVPGQHQDPQCPRRVPSYYVQDWGTGEWMPPRMLYARLAQRREQQRARGQARHPQGRARGCRGGRRVRRRPQCEEA
jgi:hypothetical protein